MVGPELNYLTNEDKLQKEFTFYKTAKGRCNNNTTKNEIIKFFQQDTFFATEKELWKNDEIRNKLIENRCKYLFKTKEELIDNDMLTGFKKSGMYSGYSHFNPLLFRWFVEKYNIKKCCDPFGGWGHRLLGGLNLDKYIYNDLSYGTCCGIQSIIDYFGITNTEIWNLPASEFIDNTELDYEAIFTCPPYFNVEHYECGDFETIDDYYWELDAVMFAYENNPKCKYMGIVLREDLLSPVMTDYIEAIPLNVKKMNHLVGDHEKHKQEYLYIWAK